MTAKRVLQSAAVHPLARLAVAALLLSTASCRGSSFESRTLLPPPDPSATPVELGHESYIVPGEYLAWSVKWRGFDGARTQWIVGDPGTLEGRRAIIAKSETRGDGLVAVFKHVRDELTTVIDLDHGRPTSNSGVLESGRDVERLEVTFSGDRFDVALRENSEDPKQWEQRVPDPNAHADDLHTAMAHLRRWSPPAGTRGYLFAQSGVSFYKIDVAADRRETITTEAGTFDTVRLEGTAHLLTRNGKPPKTPRDRRFTLWFSDDDYHLPVRIVAETTFGDVYAELAEYSRPEGVVPLVIRHSAR